jgi:hypothetical protein
MENMNMTRMIRWAVPILVLLGMVAPAEAQTSLTKTTLSAVVSTLTDTTLQVTSATGFTAGNVMYVEDPFGGPGEAMSIQSVSGTTITVRRGAMGTRGQLHTSGAAVYTGGGHGFYNYTPSGRCVATDAEFVPHINVGTGEISQCYGSQWAKNGFGWAGRRVVAHESFDRGWTEFESDDTAKVLTDASANIGYGSPLGMVYWREELGKTASSVIFDDGKLDVSADDGATDAEGVEILWGSIQGTTLGVFTAGTTGACISAVITIQDVSGTDFVSIGFHQNEALVDAATIVSYTEFNTIGIHNAEDGSILSVQEIGEATDTDDTGVNWADTESRGLKVCIDDAGVPTAFYTAALTDAEDPSPIWLAAGMGETGSTWTAGVQGMASFIYLAGDDGTDADVRINWVTLETW